MEKRCEVRLNQYESPSLDAVFVSLKQFIMNVRLKPLLKFLFQGFKRFKVVAPGTESSKRIPIEKEANYDPPLYVYNTHGVIEFLSDQCNNSTCTCKDRCQLDDLIFRESALLDEYKRKMREQQKRDNGA